MFSKASNWFKALSTVGKTIAISTAGVAIVGVASASSHNSPPVPPTPTKPLVQQQASKTEHKTVTTTEPVAFVSSTVNDATLAQGTTKITTAGINGTRTHVYDVTYTNGVEVSRVETSNTVTTQPTNQVTAVGTYVAPQLNCPNGTYVNAAKNTVCSPYQSNSAPAGATAQCADGSYSFSQSRSGTCSHHGGVATWL